MMTLGPSAFGELFQIVLGVGFGVALRGVGHLAAGTGVADGEPTKPLHEAPQKSFHLELGVVRLGESESSARPR